jgi:hypothetical protein
LASERLAKEVRAKAREVRQRGLTGDQYYIAAAELVVSECIRLGPRTPQAQDFFRRPAIGEMMPWTYSARLFSVADALFQLREIEGFDALCERALKGDMRTFFAELYAARVFHSAGYVVSTRPEMGIKKYDYDFTITMDFRRTNVEVTSIAGKEYSSKSVIHALREERKQLPEDVPAVIFATVPSNWFDDPAMDTLLLSDIDKFFYGVGEYKGTSAINVVVLIHEDYRDMGQKGRLSFLVLSRVNLSARHPCDNILPLIDGTIDRLRHTPHAKGVDEIELLLSTVRKESAFFLWAEQFWDGPEAKW